MLRSSASLQRSSSCVARCPATPRRWHNVRRPAAAGERLSDGSGAEASSLESLDALLGADAAPQHPDSQLVPWWQLKAQQSAPPRQQLLHPPGEVARFVTDQAMYATRVRSGKSTAIGGELDLPQVEPYFCYLLMATQLAVYAAGTWLAVSQGAGSAEQWALALSMQPAAVLESGEWWRLVTCLLLHGGLTHLALDTFFLGWMGPGIEALLGHSVFVYIYLCSGLAGSGAVLLASESPDPLSGATAATIGLVGAMLGYELRNMAIVKQSLASRRSMAEDGKAGSSALRKPWGALGICGLLFGLSLMPGSMVDNTSHMAGLATGLALGWLLGPKFTLVQEVDIPVGSMSVPEDAPATVVVLDRRTGLERLLVGGTTAGVLAGVLLAAAAAKHTLG